MAKPKLLLATPLTGAVSGLEAVTRMTLDSPLAKRWDLLHCDTATSRDNRQRGLLNVPGLLALLRAGARMRTVIETEHPQAAMIQAGTGRAAFLKYAYFARIAKRHGVRIIAKFGGEGFDRWYESLAATAQRAVRHALLWADAILVEAACLGLQLIGIVPGDGRVRWAYLGIDHDRWKVPVRHGPMRRLLFVGHISRTKGAVDLLTALPLVQARFPNVTLQMLGESLAREPSIAVPRTVRAEGVLSGWEKHAAFERADVFVFPSWSEGFPVAVLEAMASGLPIVCTAVGALPAILPGACRFVAKKSPSALAEGILEVIRDPRASRWMGAEARRRVEEQFSLSHYADGMVRAVGDLVEA